MTKPTSATSEVEILLKALNDNSEIRKVADWRLHNSAECWSEDKDEDFDARARASSHSYRDLLHATLDQIGP